MWFHDASGSARQRTEELEAAYIVISPPDSPVRNVVNSPDRTVQDSHATLTNHRDILVEAVLEAGIQLAGFNRPDVTQNTPAESLLVADVPPRTSTPQPEAAARAEGLTPQRAVSRASIPEQTPSPAAEAATAEAPHSRSARADAASEPLEGLTPQRALSGASIPEQTPPPPPPSPAAEATQPSLARATPSLISLRSSVLNLQQDICRIITKACAVKRIILETSKVIEQIPQSGDGAQLYCMQAGELVRSCQIQLDQLFRPPALRRTASEQRHPCLISLRSSVLNLQQDIRRIIIKARAVKRIILETSTVIEQIPSSGDGAQLYCMQAGELVRSCQIQLELLFQSSTLHSV
ncbi:uncharacterized protein LOC105936656 [Fundulus heteroclitus]|uniref:uncharacterized protein LOC105936656 n=1 Tax=Fundulus heteroclitus TaxID=8078 RepID=UPI00165A625F|nr:uncharacterized protein LOC105936656 [Fundulus heteroclitus]